AHAGGHHRIGGGRVTEFRDSLVERAALEQEKTAGISRRREDDGHSSGLPQQAGADKRRGRWTGWIGAAAAGDKRPEGSKSDGCSWLVAGEHALLLAPVGCGHTRRTCLRGL